MTTNRSTYRNTNLAVPITSTAPDPERHARKCEICHHPDREAIEESFVLWMHPQGIARVFEVNGGSSAVYRHAYALGLYELRRKNMREAAEKIIEKGTLTHLTSADVLHAIELHARFSPDGERAKMIRNARKCKKTNNSTRF